MHGLQQKPGNHLDRKSRQITADRVGTALSAKTTFRIITAAMVALLISVKPITADDLAWHDHQFMQSLSVTQLDSLARIHATRQRDQATSPDLKARWQQKLAELARNEMWFADSQDRSEILQHNLKSSLAIEGIQDPLLKFRLRTETGQMIQAESEAALVNAEAGSLYGKQPFNTPSTATKRIQQLESELQRLDASGTAISGRDSPFNSQQKVVARDELRVLIASIKCQNFHWLAATNPTNIAQQLNSLNANLESMLRSTRSDKSKSRLQTLLTELAARYSSEADYRLRMTPLVKEQTDIRAETIAEIRIRYHLRQREIDSAARYLGVTSSSTRLEKQKWLWLACEICIGQIEQAIRLDDAAMISSAKARLKNLQSAIPESEIGTYIDAARRCLQKSQRILDLGPELSTLITQVDNSRQVGDNEKALQQINLALRQLAGDQRHTAKPELLLIATQLNIDLKRWSDAITTSRSAVAEFQQHGMPDKAAAADLLKCFSMAQVIGDRPEGKSEYLTALENHGRTFGESPTSAIAVKWMLQLTLTSSPEVAVRTALQRLKQSKDATERTSLLSTVDELLWQGLTSSETKFDQQLKTWHSELQQVATNEWNSKLEAGQHTSIAMQLIVDQPTVSQINSWHQKLIKQATQQTGIEQDLQYQILNLVLNAKQSVVVDNLKQQRLQALQRPSADLWRTLNYLHRILDASGRLNQIQSGDIFLARTIDQLAIRLLNSSDNPAAVALKLLPTISKTASMTGDQDAIQQVMEAVSPDNISPDELQNLVPSLSQLSIKADNQQSTMTEALKTVLIDFWRRLMASQPAGSDLWLEGLIQVGTLESKAENTKDLIRQFQMANVLYPEWGNPQRKIRATNILKRLQASP